MSEFMLLGRIRNISPDAARVLERADMRTDSLIRSLTREDLKELFPGPEKFKLRRHIFETIHRPVDGILKDLKGFIPQEYLRSALSSNGVLVDYLHVLKDMKTQMNQVQGFLDAHIGLLEELSKEKPSVESDKGRGKSDNSSPAMALTGSTAGFSQGAQDSLRGRGRSDYSSPVVPLTGSTAGYSQGAQGNVRKSPDVRQDFVEVRYHMVVSGITHGAHQQLMDKVLMIQAGDRVQFVESSGDHQITILFCPNSSRIESNVEAAMSDVQDEKPVILVLMHHERDPKSLTPRIRADNSQVVLHVHIFFHETKNGLLTCQQNETAATNVRQKLLEYSLPKCVGTRKNPPSVGAESGGIGSGGNRVGGSNSSFYDNGGSSGSGFSLYNYFRRQ